MRIEGVQDNLTTCRFVYFAPEAKEEKGVQVDFHKIVLHAILEEDEVTGSRCMYLQLLLGSEETLNELRFVLKEGSDRMT